MIICLVDHEGSAIWGVSYTYRRRALHRTDNGRLGRFRRVGHVNSTAGVKPVANGNGKSGVSAAHRVFSKIANGVAHATGRPGVFMLALLAVLVWAITGPVYRYSDTWQLVINTGTTIVTFLMVFLIQNSQQCGHSG